MWVPGPVLGIETSCDETSAAIVRGDEILSLATATQDVHAAFGGVVPEIAARAHLQLIDRMVDLAFERAGCAPTDLSAVGVTAGPGLIGPLLVGVNWAKSYAYARGLPLLGVHHMEAHLFANTLEQPDAGPPFVALLVSGGHTLLMHARAWGDYLLLGETRDDAAGEAFDKVARRIGLPYPGGPAIERTAAGVEADSFAFPRPMVAGTSDAEHRGHFDMSFSGLKTAVALEAERLEAEGEHTLEERRPELAHAFQEAAVDALVEKTRRAVEYTNCDRVLLGGGVACNRRLQSRLREALPPGAELFVPSPRLATDNAAMVARAAAHRLAAGERSGADLNADPALAFPGLRRRPRASRDARS